MQDKRIKFFSFHGCSTPGCERLVSPAADSKIDYIISVLNRDGYGVDHISRAANAETHYVPNLVEHKGKNTYRYFASFARTKSPLRIISRYYLEIQFFVWCLVNIKRHEQIIVYHSLGYNTAFLMLKRIKDFSIIGEIEEVYQDVSKFSPRECKNEYKFIELCDKYIFPTQLLEEKVNNKHKPSLIIHGVYSVEPTISERFDDGKVHVVYGGTLDPNKGGGAAAAAAEYLPENYHVHICGFGNPEQILSIIKTVQERSKATVTFEGELRGDEYKRFIQKCHIGLSTQNPDAAFNATSFPSKILVYLANGLNVVSIRIPAIETSAIADNLFFYDKQTPKEIANAIMGVPIAKHNSAEVLTALDNDFSEKIRLLIENEEFVRTL